MERARFIAILLKVPIAIGNKYIQLLMYASFNCKHPFYIYFMSQLNKTTGTTPYYGVIPAAA